MIDDNVSRKILRKADVILIVAILCVAFAGAFLQAFVFTGTYSGDAVVKITLDGEIYGTYPLKTPAVIKVDDEYSNVVAIEKGKDGNMSVRMKDADCPGGDCLRHASINLGGQNIICLPAKLVVEIKGGGSEVDGYTY
ncbi:MAG: NusG domain II-containing protein [Clostridiales Family XIII bacterium]|jgi:hypothetical protein|nr:NusG domain II-containing protein [Clostridiales Family XIII bacterium]